MTKTATYYTEDDLICVTFESEGRMNDYGVSRSPVWWEPTDITVHTLEIAGEEENFSELSATVQKAILSLADELNNDDWE